MRLGIASGAIENQVYQVRITVTERNLLLHYSLGAAPFHLAFVLRSGFHRARQKRLPHSWHLIGRISKIASGRSHQRHFERVAQSISRQ